MHSLVYHLMLGGITISNNTYTIIPHMQCVGRHLTSTLRITRVPSPPVGSVTLWGSQSPAEVQPTNTGTHSLLINKQQQSRLLINKQPYINGESTKPYIHIQQQFADHNQPQVINKHIATLTPLQLKIHTLFTDCMQYI